MKKTLTLLIATSALTAVGLPALSAIRASSESGTSGVFASLLDDAQSALPYIFVSDDDDDDDDRRHRNGSRYDDDDDDDDDDCDDDDDDEDDDDCRGGARNPAPAGTVAPPQNGLFGNGAAPQVQMN